MNKALTSDRKIMDHCRPIALAQYHLLTLALVAAGYEADRFAGLSPSCDYSLPELQERKEEWVELYLNALGAGVNLDTFPDINNCDLATAADATITAQKASLTTNLAGATNNDLVFTARSSGPLGNILQIQYVNPAANNASLLVTQVGSLIRVSLATGAGGAVTTTAAMLKTKIQETPTANAIVSVAYKGTDTGAGLLEALAATNFAGGSL